jgi:hypothetical protein
MTHVHYVTTVALLVTGLAACTQHAAPKPIGVINTHSIPARADPGLAGLATQYADQFPDDAYFWTDPRVRSRLESLLGGKFPVFLGAMQMKSRILNRQNVLTVTGFNMRDRTYAAAFALDLGSGAMYVRLRERGRDSVYPANGASFALPAEIKSYCDSWSAWPESIALAQGKPKVSDEPVIGTLRMPTHLDRDTSAAQPTPTASSRD